MPAPVGPGGNRKPWHARYEALVGDYLIAGPDRDLDGIPDQWEAMRGMNPSDASDALVDADHGLLGRRPRDSSMNRPVALIAFVAAACGCSTSQHVEQPAAPPEDASVADQSADSPPDVSLDASGEHADASSDLGSEGDAALDSPEGSLEGGDEDAGPQDPDCVDIVLTTAALTSGGSEWSEILWWVPDAVWRTESGLHAAVQAFKFGADGGVTLNQAHPILVIATFDPTTGVLVSRELLDLLPAYVVGGNGGFTGGAGYGSEQYAVGVAWAVPGNGKLIEEVTAGTLGGATVSTRLSEDTDGPYTSKVFWDGEAFAVTGWGGSTTSGYPLYAARVGPDGALVLPWTQFGYTGAPGYGELGFKTSTDPVSGNTYAFVAPGVQGHARDGTPLPLAKVSEIDGMGSVVAASAVAAHSAGVWLNWTQERLGGQGIFESVMVHLGADGQPTAPLLYWDFDAIEGPPIHAAAHMTEGGTLILAGDTSSRLHIARVTSNGQLESFWMMDYEHAEPVSSNNMLDLREMHVTTWGQEAWVSFEEQGGPRVLRILRAKNGCKYPRIAKPFADFDAGN